MVEIPLEYTEFANNVTPENIMGVNLNFVNSVVQESSFEPLNQTVYCYWYMQNYFSNVQWFTLFALVIIAVMTLILFLQNRGYNIKELIKNWKGPDDT